MLLHYLAKRRNTKVAFSLKCCISELPEFNHAVAAWFLHSFRHTTHTHAAVWLPKSCNQCVQLRAVGGSWFRRKEVENAAGVGLCCTHNAPVRCLLGFLFRKVIKTLERWGEKTKHHLMSYFLSNTSAKNYRNRIVYVKIIASQSGTFFETQRIYF